MTSLPPKIPERLRYISGIISAYNTCLILENTLQLAVDKGEDVSLRNKLVYIRILGYLIHYVPTDQGLKNTVKEISSCTDDSTLLDVGKMYYDHFIRACTFPNLRLTCDLDLTRSPVRANRSPIPTRSNHASGPSFDMLADTMNDSLVETPQSHAEAKNHVGLVLFSRSRNSRSSHSSWSGPYSRWISLRRD